MSISSFLPRGAPPRGGLLRGTHAVSCALPFDDLMSTASLSPSLPPASLRSAWSSASQDPTISHYLLHADGAGRAVWKLYKYEEHAHTRARDSPPDEVGDKNESTPGGRKF